MIRINRMTDYAIRSIRAIYYDEQDTITSIKISEKEDIPISITMKVLRKLKQNNIVSSVRGRGDLKGGFSLIVDPKEVTLLDIIVIMEGDIAINDCIRESSACNKTEDCNIHKELERINEIIKKELQRHSLYRILCEIYTKTSNSKQD